MVCTCSNRRFLEEAARLGVCRGYKGGRLRTGRLKHKRVGIRRTIRSCLAPLPIGSASSASRSPSLTLRRCSKRILVSLQLVVEGDRKRNRRLSRNPISSFCARDHKQLGSAMLPCKNAFLAGTKSAVASPCVSCSSDTQSRKVWPNPSACWRSAITATCRAGIHAVALHHVPR